MACSICLEEDEELISWECGTRSFCRSCSIEWIQNNIKESIIPNCIHGCKDHGVSLEFVEKFELDKELLDKAKYIFTEAEIPTKYRIYCANCTTPLNGENQEKKITCATCTHDTCINCKSNWTQDHICKDEDTESLKTIKKAGYQICTCGLIIERIEFCNKIFCKCKRLFCYKCNTDYVQNTKMCLCNDYDEDMLFSVYVDNIIEIFKQTTINPNKLEYNSWKRQFTILENLIKNYKENPQKDLHQPIIKQIILVAMIEYSVDVFYKVEELPMLKKLQMMQHIIKEQRYLKNEVIFLRHQFTSTYFDLVKAKRRIHELESENKKKRIIPPMPLFPSVAPINLLDAFTIKKL
jgi:hypothetical protein